MKYVIDCRTDRAWPMSFDMKELNYEEQFTDPCRH